MRVKVSLPSYRQVDMEISPAKTIRDLKKLICERLEIEPELSKLMLRGKYLPEAAKVLKLKDSKDPVVVDYLWARHLILWGLEAQKKIRNATVLLAGAGAIGNEVAKNLALLGVGRLLIVDRDTVELSNISRMIYFEPGNLGMNKAEVLARNIHRKYPFVDTLAFRGELETMPLKFYLDSDVIVCGLDNVVSRIFLAQLCRKYSIPMVDGGITGLNARVHVYIPPEDACPICIFPPNQYSQIAGLRNPCDAPLEENAVPSFATSISLVSSILAQEAAKVVLGMKSYIEKTKWPDISGAPLRSILFIDMKNNRFTAMDLRRGEKCFVCGKEGVAKETARRMNMPLKDIRSAGKDLQGYIRKTMNMHGGSMRILSETEAGSSPIEKKGIPKAMKQGDYLRLLSENQSGEIGESIIRLS